MFRFFEKLVRVYPEELPQPASKSIVRFIWECTKGLRLYLMLVIFFAALIGAFEAFLFAMLGQLVDWLTGISPTDFWRQEGGVVLIMGGVIIASIAVVFLGDLFKYQSVAGNFPMRLRWNFHRQILNQSMDFFQDEFSGRISAKVMQTAIAVRDVCTILGDVLAFIVIYFVTMTLIVGSFHLLFLAPFFVWLLLYVVALRWFVPRLGKAAREQADARSLMTGRITDAYTNISTVKLFSYAGREADYARNAMDEFLTTVHRQMRLITGVDTVNHALSMLLILGTSGVAFLLWGRGLVEVGAIAAATAMALRLNGMAHWIMWEMTMLFEQIGTVQDGINTLSRKPSIIDQPNATTLEVNKGEIELKEVSFSYGGKVDSPVIQHLNLHIRPGERIGLVGRSGAGKSTMVNLLLRFYDLDQGEILIDGQNIFTVTQESLRAQVGMVTQDTSLLHRSIRDNIKYGRPDATDEEMMHAAEQAEASAFIDGLSDKHGMKGYDVLVGERGVKLSGGQRQRIAIARVMLKNAPILLLDEATSALDSEVEEAIQTSLYKLMEGKTVIAIAHRLSTIAAMDRLIVMDKGEIVEQGTHAELLELNGLYAQLWTRQSGGFLPED